MEKNFSECPHCSSKGKQRLLRPATFRTPHITRSDGRNFHLFLEESIVSRPSGSTVQEVEGLFRYDLDPAGQISESLLVRIRPAAETSDGVLHQLEIAADRLAAVLERGEPLEKTYLWRIE